MEHEQEIMTKVSILESQKRRIMLPTIIYLILVVLLLPTLIGSLIFLLIGTVHLSSNSTFNAKIDASITKLTRKPTGDKTIYF